MLSRLSRPVGESALGRRVLHRGKLPRHAYRVRLAESPADVQAAQTLRFIVFNVEMGEGLESSYLTCRDADHFDEACDHLLVETVDDGEVIGTYRLQTGETAAANFGYYSESEFDFAPFAHLHGELVELGRACVHSQHRNIIVLGLLWRGIVAYARERACRYLIGCSSLASQDHAVGAAAYCTLLERGAGHPSLSTLPWARYACRLGQVSSEPVHIPKLLSAYLSLGARICAPPAVDEEFKTIDFLTLLDLETLPENALPLFQ